MIGNRHHAYEFARRLGRVSLSLLTAAALHGACSGVGGVEDHGLAVWVGGAVHGLIGDFAFGGFRQGEVSLRRGTCCVRVDLAGLVALVRLPIRVRTGNRTIAVFAIIHKPLELGLVVGLPVCTCGSHLAARQRLRQAIST